MISLKRGKFEKKEGYIRYSSTIYPNFHGNNTKYKKMSNNIYKIYNLYIKQFIYFSARKTRLPYYKNKLNLLAPLPKFIFISNVTLTKFGNRIVDLVRYLGYNRCSGKPLFYTVIPSQYWICASRLTFRADNF